MRSIMITRYFYCVGSLIGFLMIGCGGDEAVEANRVAVVPVTGKVFLDDAPHGPAALSLTPSGSNTTPSGVARPQVGGTVKADGTFVLTTYEQNDGAAPGEYEVSLASVSEPGSMEASLAAMNGEGPPPTQPLKITIPEGGTDSLEIKLVSAQKKAAGGGTPAPLGAQ